MLNQFSRTELLLGKEALDKLAGSRVAVFGIGGVGGYVCEALVRSGVGEFDLVDDDKVCLTNLNRQIIATRKTIGKYKVEVMRDRILEINPDAKVNVHKCFFLPENADEFPFEEYDYIVDAVDTVTAKISLVMAAKEKNVPIISSMGAGNKLDPSQFKVADIYKTKVCPLAKVMRRELKKRRVKKLKVVYSEEMPIKPKDDMANNCRTNCICPPGAQHKCTEKKSDSRQYSICTICRRTDHRRGSSEGFMQGVKSVTKQAFMKSIPIMCSYIFVSMAYGMMMENAGFAWYYSLLTSLTVYTGAFQFVLITFLSSGASIVTIAVTALLMNSRQSF